jgi:hypothetical protein
MIIIFKRKKYCCYISIYGVFELDVTFVKQREKNRTEHTYIHTHSKHDFKMQKIAVKGKITRMKQLEIIQSFTFLFVISKYFVHTLTTCLNLF